MRRNKGITLVALVITIIVLLILAGVVLVQLLDDNSIIRKAILASKETKRENARDNLQLAITAMVMEDSHVFNWSENEEIDAGIVSNAKNKLNENIPDSSKVNTIESATSTAIVLVYQDNLWSIDRNNGKLTWLGEANARYTGEGEFIDALSEVETNARAKEVDIAISTQEQDGGHNIVYTSNRDVYRDDYSNEITWIVGDVKLAAQIYCSDNVMIYDGTQPYIPVMIRFYRKNDYTGGLQSKRNRGLNYVKVDGPVTMTFSTNNDNNDWAFVDSSWYNYTASSNRKCSSTNSGTTTFNDITSGHYFASGRLTYTNEPSEIITNLGGFSATFCDQDGNIKGYEYLENDTTKTVVGSNYVIDVRTYNSTMSEAQELLNTIEHTSTNAAEIFELSKAVLKAAYEDYTFNDPNNFASQIEEHITKVRTAVEAVREASGMNVPQISDAVRSVFDSAQQVEIKIEPETINGGSNMVYTSNENVYFDDKSQEVKWTVSGVTMAAQIYCSDNVMIYDGENPVYAPIMVRFYRKNENTGRSRGLKYFKITSPVLATLSTNNNNNDWAFVANSWYNYTANSDRKCSSTENVGSYFNDKTTGHYYAFGRLNYNPVTAPTDLLINLGALNADCQDQDGNVQTLAASGSNYVVNVKKYYDKIDEAKAALTIENLYYNVDATYNLALGIINLLDEEYDYSNPQTFASKLQQNMDSLDNLISQIR